MIPLAGLPAPLSADRIDHAQRLLGFTVPPLLVAVYRDFAGPGPDTGGAPRPSPTRGAGDANVPSCEMPLTSYLAVDGDPGCHPALAAECKVGRKSGTAMRPGRWQMSNG
jgi:hypothetical protein